MVKYYKRKLTKTGVTTMGQEGYGTSMHDAEELTDGNSLREAVTKYAERATQEKERMAQMEEKVEKKFAVMSMQQPPQPTYYQQPTPPICIPNTIATTTNTHTPDHN